MFDPGAGRTALDDWHLEDVVSSARLDALRDLLPEDPTHCFRLLRGDDLLHLHVLAYRCRLAPGTDAPRLVPRSAGAWLEVRLPFQHMGERAFFEITTDTRAAPYGPPDPPGSPLGEIETVSPDEDAEEEPPGNDPPTDVRAAFGSRLVYDLPEGEEVPFTTAGVLAALSRLQLRVTRLATPRREEARPPGFHVPVAPIGGGLVLMREPGGLLVRRATRTWLRDSRIDDPLVRGIRAARDAINARRALALEGAVDLAGIGDRSQPTPAMVPPWLVHDPIRWRRFRREAELPQPDETAIEAPYRLVISPSVEGGFAHSTVPVAAPTDDTRVELWHSRLGVRRETEDGWTVDERADPQRIVRAVWARDMEHYTDAELDEPDTDGDFEPFRTSLDNRDRRILVRQSAETVITDPDPVDVEKLHVSSLGAWLDLHGAWDTDPYSAAGRPAILSWDHDAPMGRDQFVRVVYPGYLFPFGHRAALVKVTERKIKPDVDPGSPQARLYQRKFIVVGERVRSFEDWDLPFREVRVAPRATPDLQDPAADGTPHVIDGQDLFWPVVASGRFAFTLDCRDHDGGDVRLHTPLLFVAAHLGADAANRTTIENTYDGDDARKVGGDGQWTAFARSSTPGDTSVEVARFEFAGKAEIPGDRPDARRAQPRLRSANVVIPAMRRLAPQAEPVDVVYPSDYVGAGFTDATEVFLELADDAVTQAAYGTSTDQAGGFVQPDLPIRQLSRSIGAIGNLAENAGEFDPEALLSEAGLSLPKLFGLFDLFEVLEAMGLDELPKFATEAVDKVAALIADLQRLADTVDTTIDRLQQDAANANAAVQAKLDDARATLEGLRDDLQGRVTTIVGAVDDVFGDPPASSPDDVIDAIETALGGLVGIVGDIRSAIASAPLPPPLKAQLDRLVGAVEPLLEAADTVEAVLGFLKAIDPAGLSVRASYTWQPKMKPWPDNGDPVFTPAVDGFTLSVEARAAAAGEAGADVLAELRDFQLHLLPGAPLMRMDFGRIAFRASTGRKPEVDVVFDGIEFVGVLGFIETLRELIPFDGFADPPYLDVGPEGVTAGFDLALPNASVGVFSLENISLGADCRVPFIGDAVTVGFAFCTRERPFRLTVMAIGGGGFVAIRLSPEGLVVLEMALEAGASLSLDFGVASGSVSVMVGVYLRLESDAGSLTGYFRIRGEVDVLGLISASITLELALAYDFPTGKMVGRASIVIEVEVLFFSTSVEVSVERRLAGSNGDPTFRQVMGVTDDGSSPAWDEYCNAFAGV